MALGFLHCFGRELHLVQDPGLNSGLSLRISDRQVASSVEEPMVTVVYPPQGIAGSDGLPGDKGELVSMAEPLLPTKSRLASWGELFC